MTKRESCLCLLVLAAAIGAGMWLAWPPSEDRRQGPSRPAGLPGTRDRTDGAGAGASTETPIRDLEDDDWRVRYAAAVRPGRPGGEQAVAPLIAMLADDNPAARCVAADALGRLGDGRAVGPLIELLARDRERPTLRTIAAARPRESAAWALGRIGDPRAVGPLIRAVKAGGSVELFAAAFEALGLLGDDRAAGAIIEACDTVGRFDRPPRWEHEVAGAAALGQLGHSRVIPWLLERIADGPFARDDPKRAVRVRTRAGDLLDGDAIYALEGERRLDRAVRWAFARIGEAGIAPLLAQVQDAKAQHRGQAVRAIGFIGTVEAIEQLRAILAGDDKSLHWSAAVALAEVGDPAGIKLLGGLLGHRDPRRRLAVVELLARVGDDKAIGPLTGRLKDRSRQVRLAAVRALAALGERFEADEDPNALIPLLADSALEVAEQAARLLGKTRSQRAVKPLLAQLANEGRTGADEGLRAAAAWALGQIGTPAKAAAAALIEASKDQDRNLRAAAAGALKKIRSPEAPDDRSK